jgi:predicted Zn-dependent protease
MNILKAISGSFALIISSFVFADGDQHSVEAISAALQMPIPAKVIAEAQSADDGIMRKGDLEGTKVYLVTDSRLTKMKGIVNKILSNLDKDQQGWVVRVLDTNPKQVNAFVTGGKYIYVFTGLIENAQSDDEIAFVLSHEIGHSFLKQNIRKKNDSSQSVQNLLALGALLSKKHADDLLGTAKIMDSAYNQKDEEEADAIAVILSKKAGYDPMRGIDFFSRSKREGDEFKQKLEEEIESQRPELEAHQRECANLVANYNKSAMAQLTQDANKINSYCAEVEKMRLAFNHKIEALNNTNKQEAEEPFFSSHPIDQARIAAIAVAVDFLDGARTVDTLSDYEQTQRVYQALIANRSSIILQNNNK